MKLAKSLFIALTVAIMSSPQTYAQFEGAAWDTLTTDTLEESISQQALATTPYQLHLAYARSRVQGGWDVYYRFYDAMAGWTDDRIVESDMPCSRPVIAASFTYQFNIAVLFESGGDIWGWINHDPFEPWTPVNIINSPEPDMSPTVTLGPSNLHAAWITEIDSDYYKISYVFGIGDTLYFDVIEDSDLGFFGSGAQPFIVAVDDNPHIFYRGVNNDSYNIHHAYRTHPDSSWIIEFLNTSNVDDYSASAWVDAGGDIRLAISGNEGWGMPGHVYYLRRDHQTGTWSAPVLATGGNSAVNGSIALSEEGDVFISSCGVSGNIYNGEIYLSTNISGSFQTELLASYGSSSQTVLTMISGIYGALALDAPIGGEESRNVEIVYYGPSTTGMADDNPHPPNTTLLSNNYPNPFNASTTIRYNLQTASDVKIEIFDICGRKIENILDERQQPGYHQATWNAADFPSGVYFYALKAGGLGNIEKMTLLK